MAKKRRGGGRKGLKTSADLSMWTHRRTSRSAFFRKFHDFGSSVIPHHVAPPARGTLFWMRNKNLAVLEAAKRNVCVRFAYKRTYVDRKTFSYLVEPYSFRFKRGRLGFRKFFYGYHRTTLKDGTRGIHSFYWFRVYNIVVSRVPYKARWPIEIAHRPVPGQNP